MQAIFINGFKDVRTRITLDKNVISLVRHTTPPPGIKIVAKAISEVMCVGHHHGSYQGVFVDTVLVMQV